MCVCGLHMTAPTDTDVFKGKACLWMLTVKYCRVTFWHKISAEYQVTLKCKMLYQILKSTEGRRERFPTAMFTSLELDHVGQAEMIVHGNGGIKGETSGESLGTAHSHKTILLLSLVLSLVMPFVTAACRQCDISWWLPGCLLHITAR